MNTLKANIDEVKSSITGIPNATWPKGVWFAPALQHGSMSVEVYTPRGEDLQRPHEQDELYFIHRGTAQFFLNGAVSPCKEGDCLFVPAGVEHRFIDMSEDFVTWVVFWGPHGGESSVR
jgi:mannose-6-phosphate isomerase-like protein (cupin superfamily)